MVVEGITSDAKVWVLHADNSGNWLNGRFFNASSNPVFSAAHPSAAAVLTVGSNGVEEQDVTF